MREPTSEAQRAARVCNEPDTRLRKEELGVARSDDEVARERELEPAARGDAIDGGDHRLAAIEKLRQPGEPARTPIAIGWARSSG